MSNADLIDLALCGGYVYEENVCECCGHDTSRWVKAEMPVMGCQSHWAHHASKLFSLTDKFAQDYMRSAQEDMKFYEGELWKTAPKIGDTINVRKPARFRG
jgi:hypothetical protein